MSDRTKIISHVSGETNNQRLTRTANAFFQEAQRLACEGKGNAGQINAIQEKVARLEGSIDGLAFDEKELLALQKQGLINRANHFFSMARKRIRENEDKHGALHELDKLVKDLREINGGMLPRKRSSSIEFDERSLKRVDREMHFTEFQLAPSLYQKWALRQRRARSAHHVTDNRLEGRTPQSNLSGLNV